MDPQQAPLVQQALQNSAWAPFYGTAFMNHCLHPQLQQLAEAQWKLEFSAKLAAILEKLREKFAKTQNVCLCQTWVGADGCEPTNPNSLEVTLWADPRLAIVLDPLFHDLRAKSCQGPVFFRNSMPGKVWRSGAVQIVQNLRILPPTLHPRSQLTEDALERLAEALYIPIYDLARPAKGQVCVLEVLLSSRATEAMLVADVISFIGNLLTALHLSLANPVQQPIRKSVLCGRRARAPDSGDEGEASGGEGEAERLGKQHVQGQQQPQQQCGQAAGTQGCQASASGQPAPTQQQQQCFRPAGAVGIGAAAGCDGPSVSLPCGAAGGVACRQCPAGGACSGAQGQGTAALYGGAAAPLTVAPAEMVAGTGAAAAAPATVTATGHCGGRAAGYAAAPTCSELPTLPASPSHDRAVNRSGSDVATAAAASSAAERGVCAACQGAGAAAGGSGSGSGGAISIPRKVRRLLQGAMQRTKSVVSVAALSDGKEPDDDDEDGAPVPGVAAEKDATKLERHVA